MATSTIKTVVNSFLNVALQLGAAAVSSWEAGALKLSAPTANALDGALANITGEPESDVAGTTQEALDQFGGIALDLIVGLISNAINGPAPAASGANSETSAVAANAAEAAAGNASVAQAAA